MQGEIETIKAKYQEVVKLLDEHICDTCKQNVTDALQIQYPQIKRRKTTSVVQGGFKQYLLYAIIGMVAIIGIATSGNSTLGIPIKLYNAVKL